jgi:hypothetical protein
MKQRIDLFGLLFLFMTGWASDTTVHEQIDITTIRSTQGEVHPLDHTKAQLRVGYIQLNHDRSTSDRRALALGGHLHIGSKRWRGTRVCAEVYTVQDMTTFQQDKPRHPDFFDQSSTGFVTLSQAFLDMQWGDTEMKLGRQMIDTPHLDSDDIRMMPNYFQAVMITNKALRPWKLSIGKVDKMAGWENGIDTSRFIEIEKVAGSPQNSDGLYLLSAIYDGIDDITLQGWYYYLPNLYDIFYVEMAYKLILERVTWTVGLQYDRAKGVGDRLTGDVDAFTYGVSLQSSFNDSGVTLLVAYNRDVGEYGAIGSFGGGPFFTSLEDQTIDTIQERGDAWIVGGDYTFEAIKVGVTYGHFQADQKSHYHKSETDLIVEYAIDDQIGMTMVYATIHDENQKDGYQQFRLVMNMNF